MSLTPRRTAMARKRYKPDETVAKLRQVDVLVSQGQNMVDAICQIGVGEVTGVGRAESGAGEALKRGVARGEPQESLDASSAPPHPPSVLSWDWGCTHGALCHSKRVLAASCTLPRAG